MKTKIKLLIIGVLSVAAMLTASIAIADHGSSNESTCGSINCQTFHNTGITHQQYPYGLNFASFNNYRDAISASGKLFEEMQFMYIESLRAPQGGYPIPTPWDSWSTFEFSQNESHTLTFSENPNDTKRIGFWIYMHNNGEPDSKPATGTRVKIENWGSATPRTSYNPQTLITATNTKPRKVWSNVQVTGNRPFTLVPREAYVIREGNADGTGLYAAPFSSAQLQNLTHEGIYARSHSSKAEGYMASSHLHYVQLYVEFEAIPEPEEQKICRSLEIIRPEGANDGQFDGPVPTIVVTDRFNNEPLEISLDSDYDPRFQYVTLPTNSGLTLKETQNSSEVRNLYTSNTTIYMNGFPRDAQPGDSQTVRVFAVDENDNAIDPCNDSLRILYSPEEEAPVCATLNTIPGSGQEVELYQRLDINLDGPTNTNGDYFTIDGDHTNIEYCYSNQYITFYPDILPRTGNCVVAPANMQVEFLATEQGTMTIDVLGTEVAACADEFITEEKQFGGICLDLDFRPQYDEFDTTEDTEYCVDIDVEATVSGYNNEIEWNVIRDGSIEFSTDTQGEPCIDFEDFNYNWLPGDSLEAVALIEYEDEDCEDIITSPERECERFRLEQNEFERGRDNEICIDETDWPVQGTGVYVSVDGDDEFLVNVDEDDCFIIEKEDLEGADHVEVWVPEWKDECSDDLDRVIYPPEFDKNVKDEDRGSASFSSRAAINFSDHNVDYKITYEHKNDEEQDVTITDTIGRVGYIQGYIASTTSDLDNAPEGGRIYYDEGSMNIWVEGEGNVDDCDDTSDDVCYNGDIGDLNGVEIENVPPRKEVVITYSGEVDTVVSPSNCSDPTHKLVTEGAICGEIYPNIAEFDDEVGFDGDDNAEVTIPCPFIIVRSGGEVFLENPFDYGVDTLSCSEIENVPVPIITPHIDTPDLSKTGEGESILTAFSDRLCKNEEIEGYQDIERISSLICELTLKTSDDLTQFAIVQNIARNIQLFARYDKNLNNTSAIDGSNSLPSSNNGVFVKDNGDLTLGGSFEDGAQTIVVIGHDVKINKDIKFNDPSNLTDPRQIPSLALIVIGGDIIVAPGVEETNGVFFVQEGENADGGRMCEGTCAENDQYNENPLVHYGSIYGDIEHLFKYRAFAGDPSKEEAAILIRFDNRIYLNTPPILGELVNVTSEVQ